MMDPICRRHVIAAQQALRVALQTNEALRWRNGLVVALDHLDAAIHRDSLDGPPPVIGSAAAAAERAGLARLRALAGLGVPPPVAEAVCDLAQLDEEVA